MKPPSDGRCPARLSFGTAPLLDVQCAEPPGHDGLHRVHVGVRTLLVPYESLSKFGFTGGHQHPASGVAPVFMTWAQEVTYEGHQQVHAGGSEYYCSDCRVPWDRAVANEHQP